MKTVTAPAATMSAPRKSKTVTLAPNAGSIFRRHEIEVVGMVCWTPEELENAQKKAVADGELRRPLGL